MSLASIGPGRFLAASAAGTASARAACACLNVDLLLNTSAGLDGDDRHRLMIAELNAADASIVTAKPYLPVLINLPGGHTWLANSIDQDWNSALIRPSGASSAHDCIESAAQVEAVSSANAPSSVAYSDLTESLPATAGDSLKVFACRLCHTRCFLYRAMDREALKGSGNQEQLPALLLGDALVDSDELNRRRLLAADSWFSLALMSDMPDTTEPESMGETGSDDSEQSARRRYADQFRTRKAQADTALELRLAQLVERERAAHAAIVDRARRELARMRRALPKPQPLPPPPQPALQQQQQQQQPSSMTEDANSLSSADEAFEMEQDYGNAEPEPETEAAEPEPEAASELANRRPGSAAAPAMVAQSLPISINRSAAVAAAAAAAEDMPTRAEAASNDEVGLPDAAEFQGMTDAERLYVMQAVSYRYSASVREHDQFGSRGPPYLQRLAEKARSSRREQRRSSIGRRSRGLSATDELLEAEESTEADAAAAPATIVASVAADEYNFTSPQPRVLRANTISVDMSRAFKKL